MHSCRFTAGLALLTMLFAASVVWAQNGQPVGDGFVYQGQLLDEGAPADGLYDFEFYLFDDPCVGIILGGPITYLNLPVEDGLFSVELDFGNVYAMGMQTWLEIWVANPIAPDPNYQALLPRQKLTPAPYALWSPWAENANTLAGMTAGDFAPSDHDHDGSEIISGTVSYKRIDDAIARDDEVMSIVTDNDGVGSGLNADLVDGFHASSFVMASSDYGRYGVAATLYEGTSSLTNRYVNEGQANSITGGMVADGALTSADLASNSVYASEIATNAVGAAELASNSVGTSELMDGAVTADKLDLPFSVTGSRANSGLLSITNSTAGSTGNYPAGVSGYGSGSGASGRVIGVMGLSPAIGLGAPVAVLPTGKLGVVGGSDSGTGVAGVSDDGIGVYGNSYNEDGVVGYSTGGTYADNGVYGETNSTSNTEAGVYGKAIDAACGVYGTSTDGIGVRASSTNDNGMYAYSTGGDGIYARTTASDQHAGYFYTSSGTGLTGSTVYARSNNSTGLALWAHNDSSSSTDATVAVSNDGSGYLIKGFGGDGGEHEFAVYNSGKVWAEGGIEVPAGTNNRVITPILQITGGSDLSEQFDVTSSDESITPKPGMVVCIDPDNPGQLMVSTQAYDRKVAGIISGAGGVKPGMLMGQQGTIAHGENPVALTGRVYCFANATQGPIEPGDLLTTAKIPGHAMKVSDHRRANGAIIGKAMTRLDKGRGLVLVLVSLQ